MGIRAAAVVLLDSWLLRVKYGRVSTPSGAGGFAQSSRHRLREALLDAAFQRAVTGDWGQVRMADVAAAAGVSRQTLYNEFGNKDRLAEAMLSRHNAHFLAGVTRVLEEHAGDGLGVAVAAAASFTLAEAADDPLLKAILTSSRHDDLLPFLTTRSEPVLTSSRDTIAEFIARSRPELDPARVRVIAEAAVRLTVSHIVLPLDPADRIAEHLGEIVDRYLTGGSP